MRKINQEKQEEDPQQVSNKVLEVGIDEVGRGAVFGPVFSAVVVLNEKYKSILKKFGVTDSKKLTPKKRKLLFPKILLLSFYSFSKHSCKSIARPSNGKVRKKILRLLNIQKQRLRYQRTSLNYSGKWNN